MDSEVSMDGQFFRRLTAILDSHPENDRFGVEDLAREVGLSKSQLLRRLQTLKKRSISQYIREYSLQKAHELLGTQAGTASEVAYRVGFTSPTYFSNCFREYFGYPPGEAKFHEHGSQQGPDVEIGHRNGEGRTKTTGRRSRPVLYVLLGLGLLLATFVGPTHQNLLIGAGSKPLF